MICQQCRNASKFRFCSNACFLSHAATRAGIDCAICHYDPITKRIGDHRIQRICTECTSAKENDDWSEPSEYEQRTDDVDTLVGVVGGGTLAEVFGGARKGDDDTTARVVAAARTLTITVKRRRRNRNGHLLRGWVDVQLEPTLRDIAKEAGCSHEQVRRILNRIKG